MATEKRTRQEVIKKTLYTLVYRDYHMVEIKFCVKLCYLRSCTKVFKRFVTETLLTLKVIGRELNRLQGKREQELRRARKRTRLPIYGK
jgi:hypothetical protein